MLSLVLASGLAVFTMADGSTYQKEMPTDMCYELSVSIFRGEFEFPGGRVTLGCYEPDGSEFTSNYGNSIMMGYSDEETVAVNQAWIDAKLLPPGTVVSPPGYPVMADDDGTKYILLGNGTACKYVENQWLYTVCERLER